ncbi:MAG TPA: carboxypeptidase regulatory-like domain-containing protein [Candidatus Paceibacterota bacterium]|nr:carboxypeptidase regulatory-like domain-containing protein [Candidatus Paceibacterota bacterium]
MKFFRYLIVTCAILFSVGFFSQVQALTADGLFKVLVEVACTEEVCGSGTIRGCTDPEADNFEPDATADDNSCRYEVPNVSNFQGEYAASNNRINVSWQNPDFPRFQLVRLVRQVGSAATTPDSGQLIYEGTGESFVDTDIAVGQRYYYAIFVKDTRDNYSSGALASVEAAEEEIPCVGDECGGDDGDDDDGGGGTDPFEHLPPASHVDPKVEQIDFSDFIFSQPGLGIKRFRDGSSIMIDGRKPMTVYIPYDSLPEVLKTIAVTLFDPNDPRRTFTFILRADAGKTRYTATIAPLVKAGRYRAVIHIVNYQNQSMKKIQGSLLVTGASTRPAVFPSVVKDVATPLAIGTGVAVGLSQAIVLSSHVTSFYDLYLLLLRGLGALSGFLGLRRRHRPWGTVYDAVTKRPIDPAYVTVLKDGQEVASAITDLDGRYGFFLPPGTYEINAGKTHYRFPSALMAGRRSDEVYSNLYYGETVESRGEEVIDRNIPLDPVSFDWNEFMKNKAELFRTNARKELVRNRILNVVYVFGFIVSLIAAIFTPTVINLLTVALYVALYVFQSVWHFTHKVVSVTHANGEPIPFAIITLFLPGLDQRVKSVVADQFGRFYALVSPGTYYVTVEEKQSDGSYRLVYRSAPLELEKGVVSNDIVVSSSAGNL